jgi:hypothetical protein
LLTALIALVSAVTLSAVGLRRSLTELVAAEWFVASQQALHLAEAGVDEAIAEFTTGGADLATTFSQAEGWVDQGNSACGAGEICTSNLNLLAGTATVRISDVAADEVTITVTGEVSGARQNVEAVVDVSRPWVFQQPVFGEMAIDLDQGVLVDSYDSTRGPYTPAPETGNRFANGDLRTNSTETNTVTLAQDVHISGDVLVGAGPPSGVPSVVISTSQGVVIEGVREATPANLLLPQPEVPSGSPCGEALDVAGVVQTVNLNTDSFCYSRVIVRKAGQGNTGGTLIVNGDGQITLGDNSNTDLDVDRYSTLRITGNVTLVVEEVDIEHRLELGEGATLKLYVTQSAALTGVINSSQQPRGLKIDYTGTSPLRLRQDTAFYCTIYATNAAVDIYQRGDFFGGVAAQTVHMDQHGRLHFDESLKEDNTRDVGRTIAVRSWRQP